ncbi:carbohydrate kinase family protein [Variovorax boronicumulans]|uniref:carbohydrate kinase family protein n=1 Tax=Variovorax boronicumulans TaxID=436515 RepID=UPI000BB2E72B|nr:carbohydrate kinase [Variovorax boronicumulans]MDP9911943.1 fructokinase [Variovorax boronicumulans]PBI91463.1 2-dehydro-3-deoxygluconokinase [Variovorax boronicumulans]GER12941.1 carbohydrate kinase [Variovorax boronicumulans]
MRIALTGEALIDFTAGEGGTLAFLGHEGGSPLNTAVACARLGQPTGFLTQLSTDLFGERLMAFLERNGVDTRLILRSDAPSTLAFVERTPQTNRYAFYTRGSADATWAPEPLPQLPAECRFLHFGSISLLQEPASSRIADLVAAHTGRCVIVFDPNVRPSLIPDMAAYRARVTEWFAMADLVKLSDEDAALLAPGRPVDALAAECLTAGARAVVVTRGGAGATLWRTGSAPLTVAAPRVEVVDTIGAGDTFTAGLSVALLAHGVEHPAQLAELGDDAWRAVMRFAATAAALNCTREGADPPTLEAVRTALSQEDNEAVASRP